MNKESKTLVVAGCTRSGMTLMMQILDRGGYPCFGNYPAFEGYAFGGIDYMEAQGKAVKVVDTNKQFPPPGEYYVIRLRRDLKQQAKSIVKFMKVLGLSVGRVDLGRVRKLLVEDYKDIDRWAARQKDVVYVDFEVLVKSPAKVVGMLREAFDIELKPGAVDCVVDRGTDCYDGMLEVKML